MRHTLRAYTTTQVATRPEPPQEKLFTRAGLCKLSGIPHVKKIAVDEDVLVDLMVGIQLCNQEEKQIEDERVIRYDTDYFSGLVELESPCAAPSVPALHWPFRLGRRNQNDGIAALESVPEEPEGKLMWQATRTAPRILSTELLYEAPFDVSALSPSSPANESPASPGEFCHPDGYLISEVSVSGEPQATLDVLPLADLDRMHPALPVLRGRTLASSAQSFVSARSRSEASAFLAHRAHARAGSAKTRPEKRAHSVSSAYSEASYSNPSLHLDSPWTEDSASTGWSFQDETKLSLDVSAFHMHYPSSCWNKLPSDLHRSKSATNHHVVVSGYRTTRLPSASL